MGILDNLTPSPRLYPCKVRTVLTELDDDDRKILEEAIADTKAWTNNGLARSIQSRGIDLKPEPIRQHRLGECSCSRI